MIRAALREYQARGFPNVQGWRNEALFEIVDFLNSLTKAAAFVRSAFITVSFTCC
jgi:hypothetical protein